MSRNWQRLFLAFGALAVLGMPAAAHHSANAEFIIEKSKMIELTGTLTKIEWVNPHCYWHLDVKDANGEVHNWAVQAGAVAQWRQAGVRRDDAGKIGETVTLAVFPARDGTKYLGYFNWMRFSDGREIWLGAKDSPPLQ